MTVKMKISNDLNPVSLSESEGPILLGMPHGGTHLPHDIRAGLNARGGVLADADWHIRRLYEGMLPSATIVAANFHRYLIDANRDPSGQSLYPGQNTTEICPTIDFDGEPIWEEGHAPDATEIVRRIDQWHRPYHIAIEAQLQRIKAKHGVAILYDCHSIRPVAPFLFEGRLPDFNIGTNGTTTCAPAIEQVVADTCAEICAKTGQTMVVNGRFKGGWTTRHYGRPQDGIHAIQMELAQDLYMDLDPPFAFDAGKAEPLQKGLATILARLEQLALSGAL